MLTKTLAGLILLAGLSAKGYAQDNPEIAELHSLVALQSMRIASLQARLSKLVGPKGELLANGRMVVNADGRWVGVVDGLRGPQGDPGARGNAGRNGNPGANGRDGKNGLPGADGLQGLDGPAGLRGAQGPKGALGAAGRLGICGRID